MNIGYTWPMAPTHHTNPNTNPRKIPAIDAVKPTTKTPTLKLLSNSFILPNFQGYKE